MSDGILANTLIFSLATALSYTGLSRLEQWHRRRQLLQRARGKGVRTAQKQRGTDQGLAGLALSLGRLTAPKKEKEVSAATEKLVHAGFRDRQALHLFYGIRFALGSFLGLATLLPWLASGSFTPRHTILLFLPFALGYYLPVLLLNRRVKTRQTKIFKELPDVLDLLGISLKAGLGFDLALYRVSGEMADIAPVLSVEFAMFFLEIKGGLARQEALANLSARNPSEPLKNVVTVLIQSAKSGTDMARALKTYTENMRTERRQKAEEEAGKLSTKLTLPLVIFILPALMLIILGPTIINFIHILKDGF